MRVTHHETNEFLNKILEHHVANSQCLCLRTGQVYVEAMCLNRTDLLSARARIASFIHTTPVMTCSSIDEILGANLHFKCENFQKTGSFKIRGATNAVMALMEKGSVKAVATHSSGNYAQALGLAAKTAGLKCFVVMPSNAPAVKREAVAGYGAQIIECEPTLKARESTLLDVVKDTGATFLHPFNNLDVIAGQSTACQELLEEVPSLDAIVAPVGGGGLVAGTALAAHYFSKHAEVLAGEPSGADDAYRSMERGEIVSIPNPQTIADGLLTTVGTLTFPIIQKHVKQITRVGEDDIISAMRLILERMKIVVEPSAAVALAACRLIPDRIRNKQIGVILSGGNVDVARWPLQI